eukprot:m51a1_g6736 hypothetical protein (348) ;mRNA; r:215417-217068
MSVPPSPSQMMDVGGDPAAAAGGSAGTTSASQQPVIWSEEELRVLDDGLTRFPGEKFPELMRCMKIQQSLQSKSVRDIVHRIRSMRSPLVHASAMDDERSISPMAMSPHSPKQAHSPKPDRPLPLGSPRRGVSTSEQSLRKRALSDGSSFGVALMRLAERPASPTTTTNGLRSSAGSITGSNGGGSGAGPTTRKRRLSQPPPSLTVPVSGAGGQAGEAAAGQGEGLLLSPAILLPTRQPAEHQAMALLQENWGLVRSIHDNISTGKLADNTDLFSKFRHNFDSIVKQYFTMRPIAPPGGFQASPLTPPAAAPPSSPGLVAPLFPSDVSMQPASGDPQGLVFIDPALI